MSIQVNLLPFAISEMFAQISISGSITLADRYGLMAAVLEEKTISKEERVSIDRILHAAYRGRLRIVDDLSSLS